MVEILKRKNRITKSVLMSVSIISLFMLSHPVYAGYNHLSEVDDSGKEVIKAVWDEAGTLGYGDASKAGILGNANEESTYHVMARESNGVGLGLIQWSYERRTAFESYLSSKGINENDNKAMAKASMDYIDVEMKASNYFSEGEGKYSYYPSVKEYAKGTGSTDLTTFKNQDNVSQAVVDFAIHNERPSQGALADSIGRRVTLGEEIYKEYKGSGADSSDSDSKNSSKDSVSNTLMKFSEDAIPNMPKDRDYGDEGTADKVNFIDKLPNQDDLTAEERVSIEKWKAEREDLEGGKIIAFFRLVVAIIGFLFLIYSPLLLLGYLIDTNLHIVDSPMLRWLTFNKLALDTTGGSSMFSVSRNSETAGMSTKRVGFGNILMWSGIFSLVGGLIVVGYVYMIANSLEGTIEHLLGYFSSVIGK